MRLRLPTFLEVVFAASAVAMGVYAVAPPIRKARDSARVDLAARSLLECDRAVHHLIRTDEIKDAAEVTLEMVDEDRRNANRPLPVWPVGADLASFVPSATNGCRMRVALTDGTFVLVCAASNRVDHAN